MPLDKGFDYFWGIPASMNYGVLAWFEGRHAKVPPTPVDQEETQPNRPFRLPDQAALRDRSGAPI